MTQQTARMTTLVDDLLTLAKLEGSPRPTAIAGSPVGALFAQVEAEARGAVGRPARARFDVAGRGAARRQRERAA